jgi:hypothetical protein
VHSSGEIQIDIGRSTSNPFSVFGGGANNNNTNTKQFDVLQGMWYDVLDGQD